MSDPLTMTIDPGGLLSQPLDLCLKVRFFSGGAEDCCHFEQCLTLEPPDICGAIGVAVMDDESSTGGCCHRLVLQNDYCAGYFMAIETRVQTPGVIFGSFSGSNGWSAVLNSDGTSLIWTHESGSAPLGQSNGLRFCLKDIFNDDQIPQEVMVRWLAIDPATGETVSVCDLVTYFDCPISCMSLADQRVLCKSDGAYTYFFNLTNNSGRTATLLYFESQTANIEFMPASFTINLAPGQSYSGAFMIIDNNANPLPPGTAIGLKAILFDDTDWCCHLAGLSVELPDCEEAPLCECGTSADFRAYVDAGFIVQEDCAGGRLTLTGKATSSCDQVTWTLSWGNQPDQRASQTLAGDQTATFDLQGVAGYDVRMAVTRNGPTGRCFGPRAVTGSITSNCAPLTTPVTTAPKVYPNPAG